MKTKEQLLIKLYWSAVRTTKEVNSKRGVSKIALKEGEEILQAIAKEFDVDIDELRKGIDK